MSDLKEYNFNKLYTMSSGISSKPEQAGYGSPFVSFSTVFKNYFLPEILIDYMNTSEQEQEIYSIKKGDVFLTRTSETIDELGMSCVALKDYPKATFSGFVKRLRPNQTNITYDKYIGFYLRSKFFRKTMTNNAIMTLRASLNEDIFSYLKLYLPDYKTQKNSGDLLYLLNSKIELNNRINAELEAMAKTLYDYWFVQFDFPFDFASTPLSTGAQGKPDKNGKPYKSSGGKMVWNEELKRKIPEGWEVENLKENSLSKLIKPGIEKFDNEKIYLATADVLNNKINFSASKITFDNRESRANMQPVENSIWFAKMKNSKKVLCLGRYSLEYLNNYILSTGFAGLKCDDVSLEYLWGFINDEKFEFIKDRLAGDKTTQSAINNDAMAYISLLIPKCEILEKYHILTFDTYRKIYLNQIENQQLTTLRDWLLPMLMNGQAKAV